MEVLGERWALLAVRELLVGSRKFSDIARGSPGLSRTMLTKRLCQAAVAGLVERLDSRRMRRDAQFEETASWSREGSSLSG